MSARFVTIDRETRLLLPPDLREWLPEDHLVHFIADILEGMTMKEAVVNERGSGSLEYPPRMLLALLIYGYSTGRFSSREIEKATYMDVGMRYLSADTHPDHDTICAFRRKNAELIKRSFLETLNLGQELGFLKIGTVSLDGTKIQGNASKHKAVSYKRAGEMMAKLEAEVKELLRRAEEADSKPLADGLTIPDEIKRRTERIEKLKIAREVIEARKKESFETEKQEHQEKIAERQKRREAGERVSGKDPKSPEEKPPEKEQYNFTDPQSRIMPVEGGKRFEQGYNAQAVVDAGESRLIVGQRVCDKTNDKKELVPGIKSIPEEIGNPKIVVVDSGFYSEKAVRKAEGSGAAPSGIMVYSAVKRQSHLRNLTDLELHEEPTAPPPDSSMKEIMLWRLRTKMGKEIYRLRKETVEPVFGIIKEAMGFRRFMLRGMKKVSLEWTLVTLAYNFRRLWVMARP